MPNRHISVHPFLTSRLICKYLSEAFSDLANLYTFSYATPLYITIVSPLGFGLKSQFTTRVPSELIINLTCHYANSLRVDHKIQLS